MNYLPASKSELEKAKQHLQKMKDAKTFDEFESNWTDFLDHLDKSWVKSEAECKDPKFKPWRNQKHLQDRKKDPLLKYLEQCRNVDQHSVQEMVSKVPGHTYIGVDYEPVFIKKMTIAHNGNINHLELEPGTSATVRITPPTVEAKSVTNRGTIFSPPQHHKGKQIKKLKDPFEIAELGIQYYEKYLAEVEAKFFTHSASS